MKNKTILVIDDDRYFGEAVRAYFRGKATEVFVARSGEEGVESCRREEIDVVLLDQRLPDGDGLSFVPLIRDSGAFIKIILITAYASYEMAVEAVKLGAYDYLPKPVDMAELELVLRRAVQTISWEKRDECRRRQLFRERKASRLVGLDGGLLAVEQWLEQASRSHAPVLISGETGTGKNMIAKELWLRGDYRADSFVSINCAALPDALVESELFGYERGTFTGADASRPGLFEVAEDGVIFLDELEELPLHMQAKLLSVLDDGTIRRVGGRKRISVNARVIVATNRDLGEMCHEGRFRKDLFYRLNVLHLHLPPLRDRKSDIAPLCDYFVKSLGHNRETELAPGELELLLEYSWPGNVRELRNVIEQAILLDTGGALTPSRWLGEQNSPDLREFEGRNDDGDVASLAEIEKRHIVYALDRLNRNHTRTAAALGISRSTLVRKMKRLGLH